jgi:DNA-binding MarR family transcriptional regulator
MSDIVKSVFGGVFAIVYDCIHSEKRATYLREIAAATSLTEADAEHVVEALIREGFVCERHMGYCRVRIPAGVAAYVMDE